MVLLHVGICGLQFLTADNPTPVVAFVGRPHSKTILNLLLRRSAHLGEKKLCCLRPSEHNTCNKEIRDFFVISQCTTIANGSLPHVWRNWLPISVVMKPFDLLVMSHNVCELTITDRLPTFPAYHAQILNVCPIGKWCPFCGWIKLKHSLSELTT